MKVILVQAPARNITFNIGGYFKVLPLGMAYIAGKLKENNIDFDVFYPRESKDFFGRFMSYLRPYKDRQLIAAISATLFSAREAFKLAQTAKSLNQKNITVLGGPITSFSAESIFKYSQDIDYVVRGEGEEAFLSLALALKNSLPEAEVPNVFCRGSRQDFTGERAYLKDLDSIGMPLRGIFPKWAHSLHPPMGRFSPAYLVETARGCNFKCRFCSLPKSARYRTVSAVIEELGILSKDFKAKEAHFIDPTFTADKIRIEQLCRRMIDSNIKLSWSCKTRVDCVDKELLKIMKEAGCYMVHYGVESATPDILKELRKEQSVEDTVSAFKASSRLGIKTGAFMILASTKYDSEETVSEAVKLIKKIRPTYVLYDQIKAIPGRPLSEDGFVSKEDLEEFYLGDKSKSRLSRITVSGIPKEKVNKWVAGAWKSFYLSPESAIRVLLGLRSKGDWLNLFKAGSYCLREAFKPDEW